MKRFTILSVFCMTVLTILISCKQTEKKPDAIDVSETSDIVEVITNEMDFEMADTLHSGWTTFKYINRSNEPHFFILEKMPNGLGIEAYKNELIPPFVAAFEFFINDNAEAGMKEFEKIPDWFYKVELGGGVGLTSPKTTTQSTIYLDPGTYVMECYVRMPNGMPHTFYGMLKEITVLESPNNLDPPRADHNITLSSKRGVSFRDSIAAGTYTFAVHFEDQKQYENMLGHDVNLVKMESLNLLDSLNQWLNTADITAFRSPAPKGLEFLGGVADLPANKKGFFKTSLMEGNYVLISEIPQAIERKMFHLFTVY